MDAAKEVMPSEDKRVAIATKNFLRNMINLHVHWCVNEIDTKIKTEIYFRRLISPDTEDGLTEISCDNRRT